MPIAVGLLAIAMFLMHGSIFLHLKTTGKLQQRIYHWMWRSYFGFVAMYLVVTVATWIYVPRATAPFAELADRLDGRVVNVVAVLSIPCALRRHWSGRAFVASCLTVGCLCLVAGDRSVSQPGDVRPDAGEQPDDLQCRVQPEDAGDHADRGRHRHALCHCLYVGDLLGLSRARFNWE